jgi:hypothetical protein
MVGDVVGRDGAMSSWSLTEARAHRRYWRPMRRNPAQLPLSSGRAARRDRSHHSIAPPAAAPSSACLRARRPAPAGPRPAPPSLSRPHDRGPKASPAVYRRRDPTATPLYPLVQHHLETFLADAAAADPDGEAVLLRGIRTVLRRASPPAPGSAQLGAVSFLHRFGSALNPHFHFHVVVLDGVFSGGDDGGVTFHEATHLTADNVLRLERTLQRRVLRLFQRRGLLDEDTVENMLTWQASGGFSLDASVRIHGSGAAGRERGPARPRHVPVARDRGRAGSRPVARAHDPATDSPPRASVPGPPHDGAFVRSLGVTRSAARSR